MSSYLWGLSGQRWHALTKHDPDYAAVTKLRASDKLTAARRAKDPQAEPVLYPVVVAKPGPGTGVTLCGLTVSLARLGADPERGDPLCPVCQQRTGAQVA